MRIKLSHLTTRKIFEFLLLVILFSPIFLINTRNNHDWGGDFALYIHQAINLVDGRPQTETGYIFNNQYPSLAPKTYPVGFPILLSPIYFLFGNKIIAFSYFISAILFLLAFVLYYFYKIHFNKLISLFAVLIIIYNPWTLNFKSEVLSELPFLLLIIIILQNYLKIKDDRKDTAICIIVGILTGFAVLIKSIGIVIIAGIIVDVLIRIVLPLIHKKQNQSFKNIIYNTSIIIGTSAFVYFLINYILIPTTKENITFFPSLFDFRNLKDVLLNSLNNYILVFQDFFHPFNGKWDFIPLIIKAFALTFFILGLIKKSLKGFGIFELFIIGYLFIIFSFPYLTQGFRYLLPILPLAIYYIISGLLSVNMETKINSNYFIFILGALCLLQYTKGIANILKEQNTTIIGPQEKPATEAFDYIRDKTPQNAVIIFIKPTVLSLYADRKSLTNRNDQDLSTIEKKFREIGANYYLTVTDLQNTPLDNFLAENKDSIDLIWSNIKFNLYKHK
jgi:4-amino-4-deoxy-L-arabinose transferase-like glycosyltransferase